MSDSIIQKDPIKQHLYSLYQTDKETFHNMFIDMKNSLDEHGSDWFSNVIIDTYEDTISSQTLYKITLYDKDGDPVLTINEKYYYYNSTSVYNVGYYIEIVAHASNRDVSNDDAAFNSSGYKPARLWYISRITYGEKFISFSFTSSEIGASGITSDYLQGSSIFLVKTNHGNIAVVRGDNGNGIETGSSGWPGPTNSSFHLNSKTITKPNYLSCVTKESINAGRDSISNWGQLESQEMIFALRNIAVVGVSDDYCIDTYYASSSPFVLADATDCIINLAGVQYFTNGIVYVKL